MFAALDSSFLLALQLGEDACATAIDTLSRSKFNFFVTDTVIQELSDIANGATKSKEVAADVLRYLTTYCFLQASLRSDQNGVADVVARKLLDLIPDGTLNDCLTVVEAAYLGCKALLTFREPLLKAHAGKINMVLIESDLQSGVAILSPLWFAQNG